MDEKFRLNAFFKSDFAKVTLAINCGTSIHILNYPTLIAHFINND